MKELRWGIFVALWRPDTVAWGLEIKTLGGTVKAVGTGQGCEVDRNPSELPAPSLECFLYLVTSILGVTSSSFVSASRLECVSLVQ